jgi:VWFA-related protein
MSWRVGCASLLLCVVSAVHSSRAQTPDTQATPPTANQTPFTLHTNARIVLTDVTVTDRNGNPVHGLSASAFRIFDNGTPEKLSSFEEHTGREPNSLPRAQKDPHVFSNSLVLHPPRVFNVIVLDTTTIDVIDQMYLNQELTKFIEHLPADEPLAIYGRAGEYTTLLANFTTDREELLKGIHKAIPKLQQPGAENWTDVETLDQIARYLSQYPGRKNVLWFEGGSNFFLKDNPADPSDGTMVGVNLQPLYDELDAARVALYPIDVRGLMVDINPSVPDQQMLMEEQANATGGRAVFNTNGIALAAKRILDTDASFYTLTYDPHDVKFDNKWHKVKVEVEGGGPYTLSYRTGYYDDGANAGVHPSSSESRPRLMANGEKAPEVHNDPIAFEVRVLPTSDSPAVPGYSIVKASTPLKKNETTYSLHYVLPAAAFSMQNVNGEEHVVCGVGVLAINQFGRPVGRDLEKVTLKFSDAGLNTTSSRLLSFDQQVNLPKGEDTLFIAVWDTATGRVGTVQLPLNVAKR